MAHPGSGQKDIQETEYHSPREYVSERTTLELRSVPNKYKYLEEVKDVPGSGRYQAGVGLWVAAPQTVVPISEKDGRGELKPASVEYVGYQVYVFQHRDPGYVPLRILAVVPDGLEEFVRALIFFHPLPTKRAGCEDAQYQAQAGGWRNIYRYCHQQGKQLAASERKIIMVLPIFSLATTTTCGKFPEDWKRLIEEIMEHIRNSRFSGLAKESGPKIKDVITASYSAGVKYMRTFLTKSSDLNTYLREVWDYDGRFSSEHLQSEALRAFRAANVRIYDQRPVKLTDIKRESDLQNGVHIPDWRWRDLPNKRSSFLDLVDTKDVEVIRGGVAPCPCRLPQISHVSFSDREQHR